MRSSAAGATQRLFGLFLATSLNDPAGLLQGTGRFMRHVKMRPRAPIDEAALRELIRAAYVDIKARLTARWLLRTRRLQAVQGD